MSAPAPVRSGSIAMMPVGRVRFLGWLVAVELHTRRSDGDDDDDDGPELLGFHVAVVFDVGQTDALPPKEAR